MNGLVLSLLSIFLFSLMGAMVKGAAATIPSIQIVFIRSLFTLVVILCYMLYEGHSFKSQRKLLLTLRGVLGGLGLIGFFFMISQTKLGEAGIIFQMIPVFVVFLSWIFLKERLGLFGWILLALPMIGAILVIKPDVGALSFYPALIGLGSSFLAACAYILVRILSVRHNTYLIVLAFAIGATVVSAPLAIYNFVWPDMREWTLLLGVSLSSVLAQVALTKAYSRERASLVSMMGYSGIVFNVGFGYLFWGEVIDLLSWFGGALIVGSCIALNVRKKLVKN